MLNTHYPPLTTIHKHMGYDLHVSPTNKIAAMKTETSIFSRVVSTLHISCIYFGHPLDYVT
jgi:hypothetical protein